MTIFFKWIPGRQNSWYKKLLLAQWRDRFDTYLLDLPRGTLIGWHRDPVERRCHHRINIVLYGKAVLRYMQIPKRWWKFTYFRPDINEHSVMVYFDMMILSIGWTTKSKLKLPEAF